MLFFHMPDHLDQPFNVKDVLTLYDTECWPHIRMQNKTSLKLAEYICTVYVMKAHSSLSSLQHPTCVRIVKKFTNNMKGVTVSHHQLVLLSKLFSK